MLEEAGQAPKALLDADPRRESHVGADRLRLAGHHGLGKKMWAGTTTDWAAVRALPRKAMERGRFFEWPAGRMDDPLDRVRGWSRYARTIPPSQEEAAREEQRRRQQVADAAIAREKLIDDAEERKRRLETPGTSGSAATWGRTGDELEVKRPHSRPGGPARWPRRSTRYRKGMGTPAHAAPAAEAGSAAAYGIIADSQLALRHGTRSLRQKRTNQFLAQVFKELATLLQQLSPDRRRHSAEGPI